MVLAKHAQTRIVRHVRSRQKSPLTVMAYWASRWGYYPDVTLLGMDAQAQQGRCSTANAASDQETT